MRKGDVDDMNTLLIFFALPVATIILSAVFQKIVNSPIAVAATAFAIFLVITFAFYDAEFLIATIIYTILAFLSAALVKIIMKFINRLCNNNNADADIGGETDENINNDNSNSNTCNIREANSLNARMINTNDRRGCRWR